MIRSFTLKGGHVLTILLGAFALVIAANAVFITLAIRSFPGEEEKKSYMQGLAYNARLEEREAQEKLGWSATITAFERVGAEVALEIHVATASAVPVAGLALEGALSRPAGPQSLPLMFHETAPGRYRAMAPGLANGVWRLDATAAADSGAIFRLRKKLEML